MKSATDAQRRTIVSLMRDAELSTHTVTFMHRRINVGEQFIGGQVDTWLDSLTVETASSVIDRLMDIVQ